MAGLAASPSNWRVTYIYDDNSLPQATRDLLVSNVNAGLQYVASHVAGLGTIDIEFHVTAPGNGVQSRPLTGVPVGMASDGHQIVRSGVAAELRSGQDPTGPQQPDALVNISADLLNGPFFLDPTPLDRSDPVPANQVEFFHVFVHETLHLLGMSGTRDPNNIQNFLGGSETEFDALTQISNNAPFFAGTATKAVHGNMPLALEATFQGSKYYHIAQSEGLDMINYTTPRGTRFEYSKYDLAILHDLGLTLINTGTDKADYFFGDNTSETLSSGAGDDLVMPFGGNDTIDGGSGRDTVIELGARESWTVAKNADGSLDLGHATTAETDHVVNVERIRFDDGVLIGDMGPNGLPAYRLYQAAFKRVPDEGGLAVQVNAGFAPIIADLVAHGADNTRANAYFTLTEAQYRADIQLAQNFIGSAEFRSLYGDNPTDEDFVALLYHNVLNRDPDPGGLAAQLNGLHGGLSRANLLVNFAESPENRTLTAANTANGLLWSTYPDTTLY